MARRRNIPAGASASLAGDRRGHPSGLGRPRHAADRVGGILGGVFTATESAAVGCLYALLLGIVVFRTIGLRQLPAIVRRAALGTGKVMFILATASAFSWILARAGVPQQLGQLPFFSATASVWAILLALNILLLILGCLMEAIAILLIIVPMILPIAMRGGDRPGPSGRGRCAQPEHRPGHPAVRIGHVRRVRHQQDVDHAVLREVLPFLAILIGCSC